MKAPKDFWKFAPMEQVKFMFEHYGLVQVTQWGETVKEFERTIIRHEKAKENVLERIKKYPHKKTDLEWGLDLNIQYLDRCYEIKKVLGL